MGVKGATRGLHGPRMGLHGPAWAPHGPAWCIWPNMAPTLAGVAATLTNPQTAAPHQSIHNIETHLEFQSTHADTGELTSGMNDAPVAHWDRVMAATRMARMQVRAPAASAASCPSSGSGCLCLLRLAAGATPLLCTPPPPVFQRHASQHSRECERL